MNVIYSDKRSRLLVENVSNLMTIDLLGLPHYLKNYGYAKIILLMTVMLNKKG